MDTVLEDRIQRDLDLKRAKLYFEDYRCKSNRACERKKFWVRPEFFHVRPEFLKCTVVHSIIRSRQGLRAAF